MASLGLNELTPLFCLQEAQTYLQKVSTLKGFDPKTREGHWQVLTIRTTQSDQTLLIFTMHPQDLSPVRVNCWSLGMDK